MFLIKLLSFLPLPFLYAISDFLSYFLNKIIKYRKKVIIHNLKIAFPQKSTEEISLIAKNFYKNLGDVVVETIKAYTISSRDISKRIRITNIELINAYFEKEVPVIVMTSHLCNWEWLLLSNCILLDYDVDAVYKRLKNKTFDKLMRGIRGRFGATMIEKDSLIRNIAQRRNVPRIIAMVSDQSPASAKNNEWYKFFGLEVPFYSGAEKISKMTNYPILFVSMKRVKRGYYDVTFSEVSGLEDKSKEGIIEKYVQLVEKAIEANPSDWLWSHKRWKHNRKLSITN
jgi:Kdo2-lipid IVA lauroyltransferase/acyltransferase